METIFRLVFLAASQFWHYLLNKIFWQNKMLFRPTIPSFFSLKPETHIYFFLALVKTKRTENRKYKTKWAPLWNTMKIIVTFTFIDLWFLIQMKYVQYKTGGAENLEIQTTDLPQLRHREILMKVYATAINRADILQVLHLLKINTKLIQQVCWPACCYKWASWSWFDPLALGLGRVEILYPGTCVPITRDHSILDTHTVKNVVNHMTMASLS